MGYTINKACRVMGRSINKLHLQHQKCGNGGSGDPQWLDGLSWKIQT